MTLVLTVDMAGQQKVWERGRRWTLAARWQNRVKLFPALHFTGALDHDLRRGLTKAWIFYSGSARILLPF